MTIANTILHQLGGNRFITFTGSKNFLDTGNGLRMSLARNGSKANRLEITLDWDDTYTMRFYRFTKGGLRVDHKKGTAKFVDDKVTEVKTYTGIYCDQLEELFTETTKLYTHF